MGSSKIKKFKELSDDIEKNIFDIEMDEIKSGKYEIESIIDVFCDPKDIKVDESNVSMMGVDLSNKEVGRGDILYISCLMRKKGSSFSSPSSQHVLRVRVIDMFSGWSYLNKFIK